jgi:hypothetical protein
MTTSKSLAENISKAKAKTVVRLVPRKGPAVRTLVLIDIYVSPIM